MGETTAIDPQEEWKLLVGGEWTSASGTYEIVDPNTMAVVGPEERVAMGSISMVSRSAAGAFGPSAPTALWNIASASAPLVTSVLLKISYDLA